MIQAGLDLALGFKTKQQSDRDVIVVQTTKARRYTVEPFQFVLESRVGKDGATVALECRLHSMGKATRAGSRNGKAQDRGELARLEEFVRSECAGGRRPSRKDCIDYLGGEGSRARRLLQEASDGPDAFLSRERDGRSWRYSTRDDS